MFLQLPMALDEAVTGNCCQDWSGITPRMCNGVREKTCERVWRLVYRAQSVRPFQMPQGCGVSGRCCCMGVLTEPRSGVLWQVWVAGAVS